MQFIEETFFNGSFDSNVSYDDLSEICNILGVPPITKDANVELHLKFEFKGLVRELVAVVEPNYYQVVSSCNDAYDEDEIFVNYHVQIDDTTSYDSDDGFDKFYPLFWNVRVGGEEL